MLFRIQFQPKCTFAQWMFKFIDFMSVSRYLKVYYASKAWLRVADPGLIPNTTPKHSNQIFNSKIILTLISFGFMNGEHR